MVQIKGPCKDIYYQQLVLQIAASTSGILYPMLNDKSHYLFLPFFIGLITCLFSLVSSIFIFILDKKADFYEHNLQNKNQVQKQKFKFSDFKKFYGVYWCFSILSPLTFGSLIAIQNYLQSVLTHKFQINQTLAGEMLSIPYYIAYSVRLLGIMADKIGQRIVMMNLLKVPIVPMFGVHLLFLDFFMLNEGIFISHNTFYNFENLLSTGFGIAFTTRGAFVSLFCYLGTFLMKDDNSGSDAYILTYLIIFVIALAVSIFTFYYDKKIACFVNSKTPQKFLESEKELE
ncbi:hypothetical protein ABPG72_009170 [Tetrahymena utriculariae]